MARGIIAEVYPGNKIQRYTIVASERSIQISLFASVRE